MEKTKLGTDGVTRILDLSPPEGMTQAQYDHALTLHQSSRDAENMRLNRFCGGLEVPYLPTVSPETSAKPKPRS